MAKSCFIYETLNNVKSMKVKRTNEGLMSLTGVFGVCGVRNNNNRVYESGNYGQMVNDMKRRISENQGIAGELEHPESLNTNLENISHKITDVNIDESGVVTGTIELLNTPKGKIAQAIVEGGLPLFISSRASGVVDSSTGGVTLEKLATYDLVGSPGFSQARLNLNESQQAVQITESIGYVTDKSSGTTDGGLIKENKKELTMDNKKILEKLDSLEETIEDLKESNQNLQDQLDESKSNEQHINIESLSNSIQKWVVEEYSPELQNWMVEEFEGKILNEDVTKVMQESLEQKLEPVCEGIQKWVVEEYSPEVQKWITEEYSPKIQEWITEEYSGSVKDMVKESKQDNLGNIESTLQLLEGLEVKKPAYNSNRTPQTILENINEPVYIQNMPSVVRPKYNLASDLIKESISRRAKLYEFNNQESIDRFWNNINFEELKPAQNVYEGLKNVPDTKEKHIRESLRNWRNR